MFTIPLTELREAWGIDIEDEENARKSVYNSPRRFHFGYKLYSSEANAFFLTFHRTNGYRPSEFHVEIARNYFYDHLSLFPEGNLPKLLPASDEISNSTTLFGPTLPYDIDFSSERFDELFQRLSYRYSASYFWFNTDKTRVIYLEAGPETVVALITMMNGVLNHLELKIKEEKKH